MKKIYSTPKFTCVNLDAEDIVCTSPVTYGELGGDDNGKGVAEGKSRGGSPIWDD